MTAPLALPASYRGIAYLEPSLAEAEAELIAPLAGGGSLALVADNNTYDAWGARLVKSLTGRCRLHTVLLPSPHADDATLAALRARTANDAMLLAVGSGTINDLCKYASHLDKKPYAVCATALSMNGYGSASASITARGVKKTFAAHSPAVIFMDLGILTRAPARLTRSGLGDALCRSTAQADWLLSHLLLGTEYDPRPFDLLRGDEAHLYEQAAGLLKSDAETFRLLARTLLLSGVGMAMAGGSYPASQGEHLIAHTMEMKHGHRTPTLHGEQIGVTTLTMARIQEQKLSRHPRLHATRIPRREILAYFGAERGREILLAAESKALGKEKAAQINDRLSTQWPEVRDRIESVRIAPATLEQALRKIDAATTPGALGWDEREYEEAVHYARYLRERFTFLDL